MTHPLRAAAGLLLGLAVAATYLAPMASADYCALEPCTVSGSPGHQQWCCDNLSPNYLTNPPPNQLCGAVVVAGVNITAGAVCLAFEGGCVTDVEPDPDRLCPQAAVDACYQCGCAHPQPGSACVAD